VYNRIHERIADLATEEENSPLVQQLKTMLTHDQFIFKQKIEIVHTLLTDNRATAYDTSDAMAMARRALAESIELWGPRLQEIEKLTAKQAHHIDSGTICTEELRPEQVQSVDPSKATGSNLPRENDPLECPSEDTEVTASSSQLVSEKKFNIDQLLASTVNVYSDKKTVKQFLTQLLPSANQVNPLQSPFPAQDHLTLPMGCIPIHVRETDLSWRTIAALPQPLQSCSPHTVSTRSNCWHKCCAPMVWTRNGIRFCRCYAPRQPITSSQSTALTT